MITINTKQELETVSLPSFIEQHICLLFQLYDTEDLSAFGGVYWAENAEDINAFHDRTEECVEKYLCKKGNIYHVTYVHNNDFATELYAFERIVPEDMKRHFEENSIWMVHEDEI